MSIEKRLKTIEKFKKELSVSYDVPESCIVWIGSNKFIVIKNNQEIYI